MHIRRATVADSADLATICTKAFASDGLWARLHPYSAQHPDDFRRTVLSLRKERFYTGCTSFVMVTDMQDAEWDGSEHVIAMLTLKPSSRPNKTVTKNSRIWAFLDQAWNSLNYNLHLLESTYIWTFDLDRSADQAQIQKFRDEDSGASLLDDFDPHWYVDLIATDPAFQKRGIASRLMHEAQTMALEDVMPLTLHASVTARGLYLKMGFQSLGEESAGDAMVWDPSAVPGGHDEDLT